jgi:hypothetical protein
MNPFKFGTIVEDEFFTDRVDELEHIKQLLDSENHLVLISPRRFGKSSLVARALQQLGRPSISIDFMKVLSVEDLAAQILRQVFRLHKFEKIKHFMKHFRVVPTLAFNPMTDGMDVSFVPSVGASSAMLEDSLELLEKVSSAKNRLIVVFDEFQEVNSIDKTLAKQLRAIMQRQKGLNYVFMGSQESMMEEIFEKNKSPFFHFGERMNLKKIPYDDFFSYVESRLPKMPAPQKASITEDILKFTGVHPYYTQQLAAAVYNAIEYGKVKETPVTYAVKRQVEEHSLDYERLWANMNRTDRKVMLTLANRKNPITDRSVPASTSFSSIKRLMKQGYVIKTTGYELEDPFFGEWILGN